MTFILNYEMLILSRILEHERQYSIVVAVSINLSMAARVLIVREYRAFQDPPSIAALNVNLLQLKRGSKM